MFRRWVQRTLQQILDSERRILLVTSVHTMSTSISVGHCFHFNWQQYSCNIAEIGNLADSVTTAIVNVFYAWSNWMPRFKSAGGSPAENIALQNSTYYRLMTIHSYTVHAVSRITADIEITAVQARSRMVLAYLWAQLLPTFRGRNGGGSLLVLGSANVVSNSRSSICGFSNVLAWIYMSGRLLRWISATKELISARKLLTADPTGRGLARLPH